MFDSVPYPRLVHKLVRNDVVVGGKPFGDSGPHQSDLAPKVLRRQIWWWMASWDKGAHSNVSGNIKETNKQTNGLNRMVPVCDLFKAAD